MKRFFLFFGISVIAISCSTHKNIVTNNNNYPPKRPQINSQNTTPKVSPRNTPVNNNNSLPVITDSTAMTNNNTGATTSSRPVYDKPLTIVDNRGRVMVSQDQLPDSVSTDLSALNAVRAFTPDQAKNLGSRYNFIPPRVIYVPSSLAKKGRKGMYYIYNQKFWYWKKEDGFFYLDANYYN